MVVISDDEDAAFIESDDEDEVEQNSETELTDSDDEGVSSKPQTASSSTASGSSLAPVLAVPVTETEENRDKRLMEWKNQVMTSASQLQLEKPLDPHALEKQAAEDTPQEWIPDVIDLPRSKKKLEKEAKELAETITVLKQSQNTTVVVVTSDESPDAEDTLSPREDPSQIQHSGEMIEITVEDVAAVEKVFPSLGRPMIVAALAQSKNDAEAAIELLLGSEFSKSEAETPEQANENNLLARSLKIELRKSLHVCSLSLSLELLNS